MTRALYSFLFFFSSLFIGTIPSFGENWSLNYDVTWHGITFAKSEVSLRFDDTSYHIEINSRVTGLASLFASGTTRMSATGDIRGGQYIARHFVSEGDWDGHDYYRSMTFDEAGAFVSEEKNWPQEWLDEENEREREAIPLEMRLGPDPLSAIFFLTRFDNYDGLAQRVRAFDADIVIELALECVEDAESLKRLSLKLEPQGISRCGLDGALVAGKRLDSDDERDEREKAQKAQKKKEAAKRHRRRGSRSASEQAKANTDSSDSKNGDFTFGQIWLAHNQNGLPLPVRFKAGSDIGPIELKLKDIDHTM